VRESEFSECSIEFEEIMKKWDGWLEYYHNGGRASWPRDAFETIIDDLLEYKYMYKDLCN
jgi:hypothetical protein